MTETSLPPWLHLEWHGLPAVSLALAPLPALSAAGALRVVIAADYRQLPPLPAMPALLCRPANAHSFWLGPLFRADEVPCPCCLQFWLSLREQNTSEVPSPSAGIWQHAARMLRGALAEFASAGDLPELRGSILLVDFRSNRMGRAPFGAGGRCAHSLPAMRPLDPDAFLNPGTGIVENLTLAPSAFAKLSFAIGLLACPSRLDRDAAARRLLSACAVAQTPEHARLKLLMESAERQAAMFYGTETLYVRTLREYALVSGALEQGAPPQLPRPAHAEMRNHPQGEIGWVEARSILHGERVLLPANRVYLDYREPDDRYFHLADTNGCSAHLSYPDALSNALLEVIERDAVGIWWHRRAERPVLTATDWPELALLSDAQDEANRTMWLLDLTHDLGVPVVAALSSNASGGEIYVGAAAAGTLRDAARKAAEEMISFWFWDQHTGNVGNRAAWLQQASVESEPWLRPAALPANCTQCDPPSPLATDALSLSHVLDHAGFSPLQVDLTRPWLGIPACRVFVPGLCDLHGRAASMRLRNLPERLHWKVHSAPEAGWNRYECPI